MSVNRENVVWQSADGTWSIGVFDFWQTGEDHEWDVEYDRNSFMFLSTGHATDENAMDAWDGANPGGHSVYAFTPENAAAIARFNELAAKSKGRIR
jgi:hypothetical protein